MQSLYKISKWVFAILLPFTISLSSVFAQNDTMYIMKSGVVVNKFSAKDQVDSVIYYRPAAPSVPFTIETALIPAGTFLMGSPNTESGRGTDEIQFSVTLNEFKMSKYEITNAQFAAFLNAKNIGSNGINPSGTYPTQVLVRSNLYGGMTYTGVKWEPVSGYENFPAINVTWYGASEFAAYVGGILPSEAQWEYACRAGTTTPFNTGDCLSNTQACYYWPLPYNTCKNTVTTSGDIQAVGSYPANAYGLYDMHGNVDEWCSDWYGTYPTVAQSNPAGAAMGSHRVVRGGSSTSSAQDCRSANRSYMQAINYYNLGFRVVFIL